MEIKGTYSVHAKWRVDDNGCLSIAPEQVKTLIDEILAANPHVGMIRLEECPYDREKLKIVTVHQIDCGL